MQKVRFLKRTAVVRVQLTVKYAEIVVNICILIIICEAVTTFGSGSTLLQNGGAVAGHSVGARGATLERSGAVHGAQTGR